MVRVNRNMLFVVVALVLGVLASFLAVQYVNNQVAARTPVNNTKTAPVVVPTRDMAKGETLGEEDLSVRDVPVDFVPADAVNPENFNSYIGQVLRSPVAKGAPFSVAALDLVSDHFSNIITAGDVAYTIQVDDTNSVSNLIVPGDHVDVLLMITEQDNGRIMPLLANVPVLATGRHAKGVQEKDGKEISYSNITLELPPRDAQRIAIAGKAGELRLLLRQADSKEPFNLSSLSKADLLRTSRPVRKGPPGVEYIIGGGKG
jgi:pilus assembly protein CpaB